MALAMLWAAFLNPTKKASPAESVREFGIHMHRLAGDFGSAAPLGGTEVTRSMAERQARRRRRRAFTLMTQAWGLTLLLGIAPPLRRLWLVSGVLMLALAAFVWMLLTERMGPERAARDVEGGRPRVPFPDVSLDRDDGEIVVRRSPRATGTA
ncbi:MAG: hypothetical protein ACKO8G_05035 [Actinomycetota bacterium]